MTLHGANLWLSLTTDQPKQVLVAGTGFGSAFTTYQSPCFAGLGGSVQATSDDVLWAVCPTGMLAELSRSTDGGAHWQLLHPLGKASPLPNSALLAPAGDAAALLAPSSQGQLLRTTDGGATWHQLPSPAGTSAYWSWIGFTDATTGAGLAVATTAPANWPWPKGPPPEHLWRTADGGATWSGPVAIAG